jgi:SAM-dependent methyltransferase
MIGFLVQKLYRNPIFERTFHTVLYCLDRELSDCESVLDLGCGPGSPIARVQGTRFTVGVEPFEPYFERAKAAGTHSELINKTVADLDFPEKSFDAVVLIGVIEHMREEESLAIMARAERWAKKKLIVTSPNGFVAQRAVDGNPLQEHLSGWTLSRMRGLGFRTRGLAGFKFLRQETHSDTMGDDIFVTIRWRPRPFWFVVATLSQILTYHVPALAFDLFHVKELDARAGVGPSQAATPKEHAGIK